MKTKLLKKVRKRFSIVKVIEPEDYLYPYYGIKDNGWFPICTNYVYSSLDEAKEALSGFIRKAYSHKKKEITITKVWWI